MTRERPTEPEQTGLRRLRTLLKSWGFKRQQIQTLHNNMAELGPSHSLKPSLFRRWVRWMEQLGRMQEKERDILSEIVAIEKKHAQLRRARCLHEAKSAPQGHAKPKIDSEPEDEGAERPRRSSLWMWFLLFFALSQENRAKKESPQNG